MIAKKDMKTRTLRCGSNEVEIAFWGITAHGWEYYLEEPNKYGIAFGYVMGVENEWGSVEMKEILPHMYMTATGVDLMDLFPPISDYDRMEWVG
jgi:hypothetical protein